MGDNVAVTQVAVKDVIEPCETGGVVFWGVGWYMSTLEMNEI
jgi:hypothetical protein